jgi:hypothetical protein
MSGGGSPSHEGTSERDKSENCRLEHSESENQWANKHDVALDDPGAFYGAVTSQRYRKLR